MSRMSISAGCRCGAQFVGDADFSPHLYEQWLKAHTKMCRHQPTPAPGGIRERLKALKDRRRF